MGNQLKGRLNKEGSETVTKCNRLKMVAKDGKSRFTDVANIETLLRLIQSVPSPKAEPIKLWLARKAVVLPKKPGWNWKKKQANALFPEKIICRPNLVKNWVENNMTK